MTSGLRRAAPTIVLAFLAALAGMLIGDKVMSSREHRGTEIHTLLHRRLTLDATQERQLEVLETRFAVTRATFDAQLRALIVNECEIDPAKLTPVLHYDGTPITARFIMRLN